MVSFFSLWLPILISSVIVFVVSSVLHMLPNYHWDDFDELPDEDGVRDALQPFDIPPSDYIIPNADSSKEMASPEYRRKLDEGPVAFLTVLPKGQLSMKSSLAQWFVYSLLVGSLCAFVTSQLIPAGVDYLLVFEVVTAVSFGAYSFAILQNSIWYKRKWSSTLKTALDGLVYAVLTAGTFGWLWPGAS